MLFYDFEFQEDGSTIEPISLGVVGHNGKEAYFVNNNFHWDSASQWLLDNVAPHLYAVDEGLAVVTHPQDWGRLLLNWLKVEYPLSADRSWIFTGYYADYDHVALSQLFGKMLDLPPGMPMWTRDIKQWISDLGNPKIPIPKVSEHNALADARWNRQAYDWLSSNFNHPAWAKPNN